jgi:hypothetical protein
MNVLPTVSLSIIAVGTTQFVCRLYSVEQGVSATNLASMPFGNPSAWLESFLQKWRTDSTFLALTDTDLQEFGYKLFGAIFSPDMFAVFRAARIAGNGDVRLTISLEGPRLYEIPFELLHDGKSYIGSSGGRIVRAVDHRVQLQAGFRPLSRMLVVLAEPTDQSPWDRAQHLAALRQELAGFAGLQVEYLDPPTPEKLDEVLRSAFHKRSIFDALYVVAHGENSGPGDGVLVLERGGGSAPIDAAALAVLLRDHPGCFVFLNSCSSAALTSSNPFSGVAQRLMADGRASAVFAMQRPVLAPYALMLATRFFREITQGTLAEEAAFVAKRQLSGNRDPAVPCFYSQAAGPEEEETARLANFLNVDPATATLAIYVPHFRMGLLQQDYLAEANAAHAAGASYPKVTAGKYYYRGVTLARADLAAAWVFTRLFLRAVPRARIAEAVEFFDAEDLRNARASHILLLGSRSQTHLSDVLREKSNDFAFDYSDPQKIWTITDKVTGATYSVAAPTDDQPAARDSSATLLPKDYALIEKILDQERTIFIVAGMTDKATVAAGEYLDKTWPDFQKRYGRNAFQLLLAIGTLGPNPIDRARP